MNQQKFKSFCDQFIAFVTGDDAKVKAERAKRSVVSALKAHIHSLEGELITLEFTVDKAEENLAKARVNNGVVPENQADYVNNLLEKRNEITVAKLNLKKNEEKIKFLKEQLEIVTQES